MFQSSTCSQTKTKSKPQADIEQNSSVNSNTSNTSASCPHLFCSVSLSFFPVFTSPYKLRVQLNFKMIDFFFLRIATLEVAVQFVPRENVNEACERALLAEGQGTQGWASAQTPDIRQARVFQLHCGSSAPYFPGFLTSPHFLTLSEGIWTWLVTTTDPPDTASWPGSYRKVVASWLRAGELVTAVQDGCPPNGAYNRGARTVPRAETSVRAFPYSLSPWAWPSAELCELSSTKPLLLVRTCASLTARFGRGGLLEGLSQRGSMKTQDTW